MANSNKEQRHWAIGFVFQIGVWLIGGVIAYYVSDINRKFSVVADTFNRLSDKIEQSNIHSRAQIQLLKASQSDGKVMLKGHETDIEALKHRVNKLESKIK